MSCFKWMHQARFSSLIVVLLAYFIFNAVSRHELPILILNIFFAFLLISSLLLISDQKKVVLWSAGILVVGLLITVFTGELQGADQTLTVIQLSLSVLFFLLVTYVSLSYTLRFGTVTTDTLFAAVCTYLLLGLTWSFLFQLVNAAQFHSFSVQLNFHDVRAVSKTFTYYSFVTLTTLGYGDITPVSDLARVASWLEAVFGQIYLTFLVAQLVGIYVARRRG